MDFSKNSKKGPPKICSFIITTDKIIRRIFSEFWILTKDFEKPRECLFKTNYLISTRKVSFFGILTCSSTNPCSQLSGSHEKEPFAFLLQHGSHWSEQVELHLFQSFISKELSLSYLTEGFQKTHLQDSPGIYQVLKAFSFMGA